MPPPRRRALGARRAGRVDPLSRAWRGAGHGRRGARRRSRARPGRRAPMSGSIRRPARVLDSASADAGAGAGPPRPPRQPDGAGLGRARSSAGSASSCSSPASPASGCGGRSPAASGAASAGSGRIRPTPTSTIRSASGSLLPLAMLSFTGFWISFPSVFSSFEASRSPGKGKGGGAARPCPGDARPAARRRPRLTADAALAAAQPHATGAARHHRLADRPGARVEDRLRARGRPGRGRGRRRDRRGRRRRARRAPRPAPG